MLSIIFRLKVIVFAFFVFSACTHLTRLENTNLKNLDPFQEELASLYLEFSQREARAYDWYDSEYFARKGLRVANGEIMLPELISDWSIANDEKRHQLSWARKRLTDLLTHEISRKMPLNLARAQYYYDCWIEQQEENLEGRDIDECRVGFTMELGTVEAELIKSFKPHQKKMAKDPRNVRQKNLTSKRSNRLPSSVNRRYSVYFPMNVWVIDNKAKRTLDQVSHFVRSLNDHVISLHGHTDTVGSAAYNEKLSQKRVKSVADGLAKQGVTVPAENMQSYGEKKLVYKTSDNVPSRLNRSVMIQVEGRPQVSTRADHRYNQ